MKRLKLSDTTFDEFWAYATKPCCFPATSKAWRYVNREQCRIIYDEMAKHGLRCEGRSLRTFYKGEVISYISAGWQLNNEPTREELANNMFQEVWCRTEWAVRCGRHPQELGYESVKCDFGLKVIKQLNEARVA